MTPLEGQSPTGVACAPAGAAPCAAAGLGPTTAAAVATSDFGFTLKPKKKKDKHTASLILVDSAAGTDKMMAAASFPSHRGVQSPASLYCESAAGGSTACQAAPAAAFDIRRRREGVSRRLERGR